MTIGRTHSGKTTFAEDLKKTLKGSVVIQTDPIAEFLAQNFPKKMYKDKEYNGKFEKPTLKLSIYKTIIHHAMMINQKTLIFANSNLYKKFRKEHIDWFREEGYKVIGVFLNYPASVLKKRVRDSGRDNSLLKTNDFEKLVDMQRKILEKPKEDEFDLFFEIKSDEELEKMKKKIIKKIVRKKVKK